MKRLAFWLIFSLAIGAGGRVQAATLEDLINAGYSAVCHSTVSPYLEVSSICALYETFRNGLITEDYLENLADYARETLLNAALSGFGDALNSAFLADLNQLAEDARETIRKVLNLPYHVVDRAADALELTAYETTLGLFENPPPAPPSIPESPPEMEYDPNGVLARAGVPESVVTGANELTDRIATTAQTQQEAVLRSAYYNTATDRLEAKTEEARKQAEEQSRVRTQEGLLAQSAESMKAVAEQAAVVTNRNPAQPGIAQQYREAAENAASDRELLELMVKAMADLMDQEAVYAARTAELLVQQARLQAYSTGELIRASGQAAEQAKRDLGISPDFAAEVAARAYSQALAAIGPQEKFAFQLLYEACTGLGGSDVDCNAVNAALTPTP